jgi:signal transduction histidine kinase
MIRKDFDFEKRNKYLTIIQQSGKNLLRVINDILDFTKLQSGKMQIHNTKVDLRTVLDDNCKLFSAKANDREVNYNYSFSENFPTQFIVDEIRIVQVMNNFISNALKFTPKGEFVNVLINYEKFGSMLTIKVVDTGIGIEKEKHEAIFIPFEQENSGTTRDYGGTGLGLAICVTLINLMGGRLIFKSEKNKGSTFGFSLKVDVPN